METETVFSADERTDTYRLAEVGTKDNQVRLYVECAGKDNEGMVELFLTQDEAYALMAALGQAARAL
jgi:hypothetical protein